MSPVPQTPTEGTPMSERPVTEAEGLTFKGEHLPESTIEKRAPAIVKTVIALGVAVLIWEVVYGFVAEKHVHFDVEALPAFYALVGFCSYVGLVTLAKGLRKIVARPEDFYTQAEAENPPIALMKLGDGDDKLGTGGK